MCCVHDDNGMRVPLQSDLPTPHTSHYSRVVHSKYRAMTNKTPRRIRRIENLVLGDENLVLGEDQAEPPAQMLRYNADVHRVSQLNKLDRAKEAGLP